MKKILAKIFNKNKKRIREIAGVRMSSVGQITKMGRFGQQLVVMSR